LLGAAVAWRWRTPAGVDVEVEYACMRQRRSWMWRTPVCGSGVINIEVEYACVPQ
jgi:hypothetical protein